MLVSSEEKNISEGLRNAIKEEILEHYAATDFLIVEAPWSFEETGSNTIWWDKNGSHVPEQEIDGDDNPFVAAQKIVNITKRGESYANIKIACNVERKKAQIMCWLAPLVGKGFEYRIEDCDNKFGCQLTDGRLCMFA